MSQVYEIPDIPRGFSTFTRKMMLALWGIYVCNNSYWIKIPQLQVLTFARILAACAAEGLINSVGSRSSAVPLFSFSMEKKKNVWKKTWCSAIVYCGLSAKPPLLRKPSHPCGRYDGKCKCQVSLSSKDYGTACILGWQHNYVPQLTDFCCFQWSQWASLFQKCLWTWVLILIPKSLNSAPLHPFGIW